MRILISTDIEGVAGVFHPQQTIMGNDEYERARQWMSDEANAAAKAALDAGAEEIIINDSHGHFRNVIADRIDANVKLLQGKPRLLGMMAGVETRPNAVFMIGYHGKAKSRSILAHTINGFAFSRIWLNDMELGEAGLYGALASEFNAPVIFASGDDVFIEETSPLFPQATFVETKRAQGQFSGVSLTPEKSCEMIYDKVFSLLKGLSLSEQPLFTIDPPIVCQVQTQTPALADLFEQLPYMKRLEGDLISFNADSVQFAVRTLNCFSAMSAMLR